MNSFVSGFFPLDIKSERLIQVGFAWISRFFFHITAVIRPTQQPSLTTVFSQLLVPSLKVMDFCFCFRFVLWLLKDFSFVLDFQEFDYDTSVCTEFSLGSELLKFLH